MANDDLIAFIDEDDESTISDVPVDASPWQVLIVDDDPAVHSTTRLAIEDVAFEGRPLSFISAFSATEAKAILAEQGDRIAVILLDVVMESDDAGLQLVAYIRDTLRLPLVRIILRTGQPGYAPEISTIQQLDINDYKAKSELTRSGLFTALAVAIRSFAQLQQMERSRRGLEKIVEASCDLARLRGLNAFAEGAVLQICSLLGVSEEGLVCVQSDGQDLAAAQIVAAAGRYAHLINAPLQDLPCTAMRDAVEQCMTASVSVIGEVTTLYFPLSENRVVVACVRSDKPMSTIDKQLLQAFCASIGVGFDNVMMHERLESEAFIDSLLGIPNRNGFEHVIVRQQKRFPGSSLLLIDIDDFSSLNATLDQHYGDDVLRAVCQRLQMFAADQCVLGRVSGDCFGLVGPLSPADCESILRAFEQPINLHGNSLMLSVTCGVVRFGNDAKTPAAELLKDANIALKQAKLFKRGKIEHFDVSLRKAAQDRIALLNGLREAFSARHLFLVYQPQIDLASGRVVGAEALLRWRNAAGEFVPPDRFIPLAEQSGVILPIGIWVMRTACLHARQLMDSGYTDFRMAVNVSYAQLRDPGFIEQVRETLQDTGVPGRNLEIELTESIAMEDLSLINRLLAELHQLDITVALDDFGTGYSSLSLLNRLDIDRLKIDRAFVSALLEPGQDSQLVKVMLHLAQDFELSTIAEGIEDQEQMQALHALGCIEGQGYYIARPMDFAALQAWMADHAAG